ncbi:hypothetical protein NDU88_000643 [Pleurodeles waltl]|uniref:Uncharacterized protein n=1 Tax=Pleurodeles waltl TaxID=8319 RepID=A0AAV7VXZ4_PLEWA|nr:hypothetical protein NDU88_000643 [Pleurodeles waltl]
MSSGPGPVGQDPSFRATAPPRGGPPQAVSLTKGFPLPAHRLMQLGPPTLSSARGGTSKVRSGPQVLVSAQGVCPPRQGPPRLHKTPRSVCRPVVPQRLGPQPHPGAQGSTRSRPVASCLPPLIQEEGGRGPAHQRGRRCPGPRGSMMLFSPAALFAPPAAPREPLRSPAVSGRMDAGSHTHPGPRHQHGGRPQARVFSARLRRARPGSLRAPPALGSLTRVSAPFSVQFAQGDGTG